MLYSTKSGSPWLRAKNSSAQKLHDDIRGLVDVRDLELLHLPCEHAPQITFTLSFLARQWSSWRCVWGRYHVGIMRPGLRREGIMLCFSRSQYMLVFMVPSMNCSSPAALMQPQTMALPPSCLTVGKTHLSFYSSPGCRHTPLDTIWTKYIYLGPIRPQNMVPVIHVLSLLVFSKLFAGFLVHHL